MKKNILLLSLCTLLVLSFTGCGASGDSQNPTEAAGPIAPVISEFLAPTECPESGAEDDLAIAIGSEALCDLGSVRFSLSLPETWDYEIRNVTTSEKITLPDSGLNGWKHTEIYRAEQKYWIYITLSDPDIPLQGNTLQLESTLPLADWYTLESDFNRIFETIRLQYTDFETPGAQDALLSPAETPSFPEMPCLSSTSVP